MLGNQNFIPAWNQPKPQHFKYLLPPCAAIFLLLKKMIFSIRLCCVGSLVKGYLIFLTEVAVCSRLSQHFGGSLKGECPSNEVSDHSERHRTSSVVGDSCKCVRLNAFVFCKRVEKCEKLGRLWFKTP